MPFVPDDFPIPTELDLGWGRLRPLRAADNAADFAAWHNSIEHISATPGFAGRSWPVEDYTLNQNEHDLQEHEADFAGRRGFTYSVLDGGGRVIGCVYVYPAGEDDPAGTDVNVRSWVSADHAVRDAELYRGVVAWLASAWPFTDVSYVSR
jgi:hypothetical protein